jgi:CRISPR/Cas system-associated endonuclease Cas3-HD
MTLDISNIFATVDRDRKLSSPERKAVLETVQELQETKRRETEASNAISIEGMQGQWERACGATKLKASVEAMFTKINSINKQLIELGVAPIHVGESITSYRRHEPYRYSHSYNDEEAGRYAVKIKDKTLKKKYDDMRKNIEEMQNTTSRFDELRFKIATILTMSTVGEVIDAFEVEAPEIIGTNRRLTHKS